MFDTFDRKGDAEFPFPKAVVFRALREAVKSIRGMTVEGVDEMASRIELKTGMSAFSWGEKISVTVVSSGAEASMISVGSGAKTIFGSATTHGKNKQNVADIIGQTSAVLQRHGAEWAAQLTTEHPVPSSSKSITDELVKLVALRDQGVLTPAEFEAQKQRILGQ
ncbi:SHOCT domain-containing protein [Rhizobium leguminosarum]|nr:SHOCT domain-containing protein [Rhizobium leguminosarum]